MFKQSEMSSKLIIKAANQKHDDFLIENYEIEWTIKYLKDFLSQNYPKNPDPISIRLIYSGKLLHDHLKLKEVIRQNSEVKSHIIHLVHSATTSSTNKSPRTPGSTNQSGETDDFDELTPGTTSHSSSSFFSSSSSSSTASNSPTPPTIPESTSMAYNPSQLLNRPDLADTISRLNEIHSHLGLLNEQQTRDNNRRQINDEEAFSQALRNIINWYESNGVSVQSNYWFSTYIQHLALYYVLYSKYINSLALSNQSNPIAQILTPAENTLISSETLSQPAVQAQANEQPAPPPVAAQRRNPDFQEPQGDREDDWLGILHNTVSFIILFSIIYYYSSFERFFVICVVVFFLFLYHNGWLTLQRRRVNQQNRLFNDRVGADANRREQPNQANDANERQVNGNQDESETIAQPPQPNLFRFALTFLITFFTSMVPDRPRAAN